MTGVLILCGDIDGPVTSIPLRKSPAVELKTLTPVALVVAVCTDAFLPPLLLVPAIIFKLGISATIGFLSAPCTNGNIVNPVVPDVSPL